MASKRPLRAVTAEDAPPDPKAKPTTLSEAVKGTERDVLETMRAKLAAELDSGVPAAYLAPINRQLREIDKEIRQLQVRAEQEAREDASASDEAWDSEAL